MNMVDLNCNIIQEDKEKLVEHSNQPLPVNRTITGVDQSQPLSVVALVSGRKKPSRRISKQYNHRREGSFIFSKNDHMLQEKPAWKHPDRYPKNLEKSTILTTSWLTSEQ